MLYHEKKELSGVVTTELNPCSDNESFSCRKGIKTNEGVVI